MCLPSPRQLCWVLCCLPECFPPCEASFGNLTDSLKQSARGSSGTHIRVRRAIVIGEVALSLVLVCGALLLARSLLKLQQLDTGVRIENVITMSADLPIGAYATPQKAALFYEAVTQRLHSTPGVAKVGLSTYLPLEWISNGEAMQVAGAEKLVRVRFKRVDPGYFNTLDIPVLAGRGITRSRSRRGRRASSSSTRPWSRRLADVAGMKDPVGKMVRLSSTDYMERTAAYVGGPDRRYHSKRTYGVAWPSRSGCRVCAPGAGAKSSISNSSSARRKGQTAIMPAIRQAVREIDPNLPLGDVATMQQVRDRTLSGASRPAWLIGAFAFVAVLLSAIGLYGVTPIP